MKAELQKSLCDKYPKIFVDVGGDPVETCMAWGIECGDGWFGLLDSLCHFLQFQTDYNAAPQVVAEQVKEKFGGLRFYVRGGNEFTAGAITFAENLSGTICEVCGAPGGTAGKGWLVTLCDTHRKERDGNGC